LRRGDEGEVGLEKGGYTYILTNKPRGVLYIGVTSDIAARMMQHRAGKGSAFARKYGLNVLALVEHHATIDEAIAREKAMKAWKRAWKIELIEKSNPDWRDLFGDILA
jgi:putative endonuclease